MTTTVINIKSAAPYDVYIGRANEAYGLAGSKWGNPFKLELEADRAIVLARYRIWLLDQKELLAALPELRGKRLACWCAPRACHGDVLAELADGMYGAQPLPSPWAAVPLAERSTVRSYINSDQEKDRERAMGYCAQYGLDYATMRQVIMDEMVAEWRAIEARRAEQEATGEAPPRQRKARRR